MLEFWLKPESDTPDVCIWCDTMIVDCFFFLSFSIDIHLEALVYDGHTSWHPLPVSTCLRDASLPLLQSHGGGTGCGGLSSEQIQRTSKG